MTIFLRNGMALAVVILTSYLAACGAPQAPPQRPMVLVSVLPMADFVERLAGDWVDVKVLVPPGANPHGFEPTIAQMRAAASASLFIGIAHPGFPFEEAWIERFEKSVRVVDGFAGVDKTGDPHLWLSPEYGKVLAHNSAKSLAHLLPQHAEEIERRRAALEGEITRLDRDLRAIFAEGRTSFLAFHDSWSHLAKAYGLRVLVIEHDGHEPSPDRLAKVIEDAKRESLSIVFMEPQIPSASADLVAREIGGRVVLLDPLARDWAENLKRIAREIATVQGTAS